MSPDQRIISDDFAEQLRRHRNIVRQFDEHIAHCRQLPVLTSREMISLHTQAGENVRKIIDKKISKASFIEKMKELAEQCQEAQRMFLVETLEDLYIVLYHATGDAVYAKEQVGHESEHAKLFRSFKPNNSLKGPDVLFGVMNLTGEITPYTIYSRKLSGKTLVESHKKDPLVLIKEWDKETIREFWIYLINGVIDRSEGDRALLEN